MLSATEKLPLLKLLRLLNHAEDIKTNGDMIYVICNEEKQMDDVNKRFYGSVHGKRNWWRFNKMGCLHC